MSTPERVREFHGAEQLAEATGFVLNNPDCDLAIVRGVDAIIGHDWRAGSASAANTGAATHNLCLLRTLVPELEEVDEVVQNWVEQSELEIALRSIGLHAAYRRDIAIGPHYDMLYVPAKEGPVSFSARVDTHKRLKRSFYSRRPGITTFLQDGSLSPEGIGLLDTATAELNKSDWNRRSPHQMSRVDQRPGDWVVFPNHPVPAIHASRVGRSILDKKTEVLIASFHIEPAKQQVEAPDTDLATTSS